MGRLSKIKSQLIKEANKRLLGEQTTCMGMASFTFCTGGTHNLHSLATIPCFTVAGQPITQSDVGSTVNLNSSFLNTGAVFHPWGAPNMEFTIDSVVPGTVGGATYDLKPASCPTEYEDPCGEFRTLGKMEQKDFCEGCRRDPSEPGCECCTDI